MKDLVHSKKNITAVAGPGCSTASLNFGPLVNQDVLSVINIHDAGSLLLANRTLYKNSFGTLGSTKAFVDALLALIKQNDWRSFSILFEQRRQYFSTTLRALEMELMSNVSISFSSLAVYDTEIPFNALLESQTRIIVVMLGPEFFSRLLCLLYHSNIHFPTYQLIIVARTLEDVFENIQFEDGATHHVYSCTHDEMVQAANGAVFLHHKFTQSNDTASTDVSLSFSEYAVEVKRVIEETNVTQPPSVWAPPYFDAVWALAFAINNSLELLGDKLNLSITDYRYGNVAATDIIREQVLNLDFEGISGRIKFQNDTGFVPRGINFYCIDNNSLVLVGYYERDRIIYLANVTFVEDDFEEDMIIERVPLFLAIFSLLLTILILLPVMTAQVLAVIWRREKSVKASSPLLSHMAYLGCYTLTIGAIVSGFQQALLLNPDRHCTLGQIVNWGIFIGYTFLFGSLAVKMWRLYRLFVHVWRPGHKWMLSDRTLGLVVILLLTVTIIICAVWTAIDPFIPTQREEVKTVDGSPVLRVTVMCGSQYYIVWFGAFLLYNTILMFCALVFAFLTRGIKREYFSTKRLLYLVVSVLVTGVMIYVVFIESPSSDFEFVFLFLLLNTMVLVCFVLLFLPPLLPVMKEKWETRSRQKQVHQFELDILKINDGTFKTVRRSSSFQYRNFRNRLFALPQTTVPINQDDVCPLDNRNGHILNSNSAPPQNKGIRNRPVRKRKSTISLVNPLAVLLEMSETSSINDTETETNRTTIEQNETCIVSIQVEQESLRHSAPGGGEEEREEEEGEGECSVLIAHPAEERARERRGGGKGHLNSSVFENEGDSSLSPEQERREGERREEWRGKEEDLVVVYRNHISLDLASSPVLVTEKRGRGCRTNDGIKHASSLNSLA